MLRATALHSTSMGRHLEKVGEAVATVLTATNMDTRSAILMTTGIAVFSVIFMEFHTVTLRLILAPLNVNVNDKILFLI